MRAVSCIGAAVGRIWRSLSGRWLRATPPKPCPPVGIGAMDLERLKRIPHGHLEIDPKAFKAWLETPLPIETLVEPTPPIYFGAGLILEPKSEIPREKPVDG